MAMLLSQVTPGTRPVTCRDSPQLTFGRRVHTRNIKDTITPAMIVVHGNNAEDEEQNE